MVRERFDRSPMQFRKISKAVKTMTRKAMVLVKESFMIDLMQPSHIMWFQAGLLVAYLNWFE
jgi:hypothetical protein